MVLAVDTGLGQAEMAIRTAAEVAEVTAILQTTNLAVLS
jgi:hypothetical protein